MKNQNLIILLLVIVLSLTGCSHEEVKIVSGGAALFDKVEIQNLEEAKPEARERHIYNKLDMNIAKLLTQIHANMSEEYWLWGTERKTEEKLSLDIYINGTENIEDIVIIPLDKLTFFNEKGDELCFYNVIHYAVVNGNIEGLSMTTGRDLRFKEDVQRVLKDIEKIIDGKLNYAGTIEGYEWPQAK